MTVAPIARASDAVAVRQGPSSIVAWAEAAQAAHQLAVPLCRTDFVPQHFRGNEHAATAAVLYGAEVGLSPLQALQGLFVIGGRPAMYARTMLAVALGAGHDVWTEESTDARAVVCAQRLGSQHVERVVVTMDQARKAGWTKNAKYGTEPATMLLARAQSQACRRIAPDALLGLAYSAEELQDEAEVSPPEPKRTARRARAAVEPAPPAPEPNLPPADTEPAISEPQLRKLHATLGDLGVTERDDALDLLGRLAGRELDSSKNLTRAEATRVIDELDRMTDSSISEPVQDEPTVEDPPMDWPDVAQPPA